MRQSGERNRIMARRTLTPLDERRRKRRMRDAAAERIETAFPDVSEIFLEVGLTNESDPNFDRQLVRNQYVRGPRYSADFSFDCCNKDCVDGGHDITAELLRAINAKRTTVSGENVCQGWQCEQCIGSTRCLCRLKYTARISYA